MGEKALMRKAASAATVSASVRRRKAPLEATEGAGHTPRSPLSPPVSSTHWKEVAQAICATASDSMARYTPERRTQSQPARRPASTATKGAARRQAPMGHCSAFKASAAP